MLEIQTRTGRLSTQSEVAARVGYAWPGIVAIYVKRLGELGRARKLRVGERGKGGVRWEALSGNVSQIAAGELVGGVR